MVKPSSHCTKTPPSFSRALAIAKKVPREKLARSANPKVGRFGKNHIPFLGTAAQDAKSVAETDLEARIVLDVVGGLGKIRQCGRDIGEQLGDDDFFPIGPKE